jgi:hypothetical protein
LDNDVERMGFVIMSANSAVAADRIRDDHSDVVGRFGHQSPNGIFNRDGHSRGWQ